MKNAELFKNKQVLVLGFAKSGYSTAKLLLEMGSIVTINEIKDLSHDNSALELKSKGVAIFDGNHPLSLFNKQFDFVIKNPGIPYDNVMIQEALKRNIPVLTEVEITSLISESELIGITGSNGKTTTTTLIYELLKGSDLNPLLAGNIGVVSCEVAKNSTSKDIIVAELSSFQLKGTQKFKPNIAVLINISPAHLDYHKTIEDYVESKGKIVSNLTEDDYVIYNHEDDNIKQIVSNTNAITIPFSVNQTLEKGAYIKDDFLFYNKEVIMNVFDIQLKGKHNLENILASLIVAKIKNTNNSFIVNVLKEFSGVKHRLQYVETIEDVKFYNNSKSTNIASTITALSSFKEPIILIAGGLDRGNGFEELVPSLQENNVKCVVSYGQTKEKIMKAAQLASIPYVFQANTLDEAFNLAIEKSNPNDVVLLSPACASWDQYKTFEERGEHFLTLIKEIQTNKKALA